MLQGKKVNVLAEAYSAHNNLLAIGSGGWSGKGFKNPDTINNKGFISPDTGDQRLHLSSVLGGVWFPRKSARDWGISIAADAVGLYVAFYSRDMMGRLLVVGIVGLLFAHIYQNIGMNLLIMPITGIPLPFISYGGTFMVVLLFLMGLSQSVWVHRIDPERKRDRPQLEIEHLD